MFCNTLNVPINFCNTLNVPIGFCDSQNVEIVNSYCDQKQIRRIEEKENERVNLRVKK